MNVIYKLCALSILAFIAAAAASEDDINEAIANATTHYKTGELLQAAAQLDYASALIRQEKGEEIKRLFPPAPTGWRAEEAELTTTSIFGGIFALSRRYYSNPHSISLSITLESPLEQQTFLMMLSNPSMVTMSDGKLIKVNGLQATQQRDHNQLEIKFRTKSGAIVKVNGDEAVESTVYELLNALELKEL